MYTIAVLLAFSTIISSTLSVSTVFENSDSEKLRYFEFPDNDGQQPDQQQPEQQQFQPNYDANYEGDPLARQGILNGTVVIVPSKYDLRGFVLNHLNFELNTAINPTIVTNGTTCICIPFGSTCTGSGTGTNNFGDNQLDVRIVNANGGVSSF